MRAACPLSFNSLDHSGTLQADVPYLFTFQTLEGIFPAIICKWFSSSHVLKSAINLFISVQENRSEVYVEERFLTATQSLEAFSRGTVQAEYMAKHEYEDTKRLLNAAIPKSVGADHRAALKSRINFGNEHSLRKRISTLLNSLSEATVQCVCASKKDFINGIVDTRNYLTHLTDDLRRKALATKICFGPPRRY